MNKKILLIAVVIIVLLGATYFILSLPKKNTQVSCTTEAKLCSDGTAVGRTGPNCEFAACPEEISIAGWKTFTDTKQGIQFLYPEKLSTNYMNVTNGWPLKITISNGTLSCSETPSGDNLQGQTIKGTINNRTYCVGALSEGAAGSIYNTYTYTTEKDGKLIIANFTVQYPQCVNYDDPQKTACQNEQATFNLDGMVDRIIQTIVVENDFKGTSFQVDGRAVTLRNGTSTQYFGNSAIGDLNEDGKVDVGFLLTQDLGGSGTFYYVAVALRTDNGYQGINGILLGDRIAPQTTEIINGDVVVNYADRKPGEPMTTKPSVGVSRYFKVTNNQLVEIVK